MVKKKIKKIHLDLKLDLLGLSVKQEGCITMFLLRVINASRGNCSFPFSSSSLLRLV